MTKQAEFKLVCELGDKARISGNENDAVAYDTALEKYREKYPRQKQTGSKWYHSPVAEKMWKLDGNDLRG